MSFLFASEALDEKSAVLHTVFQPWAQYPLPPYVHNLFLFFFIISLGMMCLRIDFFGFALFGIGLLHLPRSRIELINSCDYLFPPGSLRVSLINCNTHKDKCLALPCPTVSPRLKHIITGQHMLTMIELTS